MNNPLDVATARGPAPADRFKELVTVPSELAEVRGFLFDVI